MLWPVVVPARKVHANRTAAVDANPLARVLIEHARALCRHKLRYINVRAPAVRLGCKLPNVAYHAGWTGWAGW